MRPRVDALKGSYSPAYRRGKARAMKYKLSDLIDILSFQSITSYDGGEYAIQ